MVTERLDPMLRELLGRNLVERHTENGRSGWQLAEWVQRRLDDLDRASADPDKVELYFGHRCAVCNEDRSTRRHGGRLICDDCAATGVGDAALGRDGRGPGAPWRR
ncbi:MAG TPA: hypothetical protein VE152_12700 [Acidimicrobiales bacterium]|nr:hypothetical protein [Acidimicrobiales bacterium]